MRKQGRVALPFVTPALVLVAIATAASAQDADTQARSIAPAAAENAPVTVASQPAATVTATPATDTREGAATTSAPAAAQTVTLPATTVGATPGKIYGRRKVVRDGVEYYCKREKTTGSRLQSKESCLTMAQLEQIREASRDFLDDNNRVPGGDPNVNGGQMSAMPMSINR